MKPELEEINKLVLLFMCEINHPYMLEGKSKREIEKLKKRIDEFGEAYSEALSKNEITPLLKKYIESFRKLKYRFDKRRDNEFDRIYDVKTLVNKLKINEKTIRGLFNKKRNEYFYITKSGTRLLLHKESVHSFVSKNSYKYVNGIKSPCNYDRLPEYLKIEECAKILKLENGRQFRRNYIDNNPARLESVEILKIGSTVRIEKESFLRYVENRT